jgi:O-antigen/teichoic acid export membrane protein
VFGVTVLSYYAIVSTLFNHIHMVLGAMTSWLFPQIVKSVNDEQAVNEMYLEYRNISLFLSVLALAIFSLMSELFFKLWLGEEAFLQIKEMLRWYMIFELFFVFTLIPNNFLNASGNERNNLRLVLIYTSLNLCGILIGAIVFNSIEAMLIGLVISTIIGMYVFHKKVNSIFNLKTKKVVPLIILFIPSILGAGIAFFDSIGLKAIMFFACLLSLYLIHVRVGRTNFKLLLQ